MSKKLRELLESRKEIQTKFEAINLEGKSAEELVVLDKEIETMEASLKSIDREIKIEVGKQTIDVKTIVEKEQIKAIKIVHYYDDPEYKTAFFAVMSEVADDKQVALIEKALTTGNNGAVIPTTTFQTIIRKLEQTNLLFARIRKTFVKGNFNMVSEDASQDAIWNTDEGVAVASETLTTKLISFSNHELNKLVQISKKLLNEGIDDTEAFVVDEIVRKFGVALDKAIAIGTGVGQPLGLLVDPLITNVVGYDMSDLDSTTYDGFQDVLAALPAVYESGAVLVMHKQTFYKQFKKIKDNDGRPMFALTTNTGGGVLKDLDGWPVILSDYYPTYDATAEDDVFMTFGNLFGYNLNISKVFELLFSTESSFKERLVDYLGTMMADGKVVVPEGFVNVTKDEVA